MNIIKVGKQDTAILQDILTNRIDPSNRKKQQPTAAHLQAMLDDDRTYLFAALIDESVAGYALAYRFPSLYSSEYLAYLYDIEVAEIYRRKGIGKALIKEVIKHVRLHNVKELWLGTGVDNPEGQGLFSATGAVKSDEIFNDYTYYLD